MRQIPCTGGQETIFGDCALYTGVKSPFCFCLERLDISSVLAHSVKERSPLRSISFTGDQGNVHNLKRNRQKKGEQQQVRVQVWKETVLGDLNQMCNRSKTGNSQEEGMHLTQKRNQRIQVRASLGEPHALSPSGALSSGGCYFQTPADLELIFSVPLCFTCMCDHSLKKTGKEVNIFCGEGSWEKAGQKGRIHFQRVKIQRGDASEHEEFNWLHKVKSNS